MKKGTLSDAPFHRHRVTRTVAVLMKLLGLRRTASLPSSTLHISIKGCSSPFSLSHGSLANPQTRNGLNPSRTVSTQTSSPSASSPHGTSTASM